MSRRGRWLLAGLAAALLLAALLAVLAWRVMQPERLTPILLRQASQALGLELRVREPAEYALRPEPRLLLRGLSAHRPGEDAPLLTAERAELSLPWATLRGRALEITRIDLLQPRLDMSELLAWLQARPAGDGPARLPTFTRGLALVDGELAGGDWRIDGLDVELTRFEPGRPTQLDASGRLHAVGRVLPFTIDLTGTLDAADDGVTLGLSPLMLVARDGEAADAVAYRLATTGEAGFGGGRAWLDAPEARIVIEPSNPEARLVVALQPLQLMHASGTTTLAPAEFASQAAAAVPALAGQVQARLADALQFDIRARMDQWPDAWPALPEPLASADGPFMAELAYDGPPDLGVPIDLDVVHGQAVLASRFVLPELLAWSLPAAGSPLPPLTGQLQAGELRFGNTRLEGVSVVIHDDPEADAQDDAGDDATPAPKHSAEDR